MLKINFILTIIIVQAFQKAAKQTYKATTEGIAIEKYKIFSKL
jgi:hypothetical protein